ncbi:hypothetical protein ACPUYX_11295 [Desulfosporosinus sp. SYSU MS00001]|uniref:DISARM anti-phage system protein DrmE domain-containing protein n=1 Tax=Desulfosporosinus sp. SYSU MS00001 TaxID=3416284 RepID=UPI003CEE762C
MNLNNLLRLYDYTNIQVSFKSFDSHELLTLANLLDKFKIKVNKWYEDDEYLVESLNLFKKVFYKFLLSFLPYSNVINIELEKQMLCKFYQIKSGYPELFSTHVRHIAELVKELSNSPMNYLTSYLCDHINQRMRPGYRVALVTKRAVSSEERQILSQRLRTYFDVNFFTENSFKKEIAFFDEVIYIGNINYYGDYAKNTFKGNTTFISYDIFSNEIIPKKIFEDIDEEGTYSTIFNHISFGESAARKSVIDFNEKELINQAVSQFIGKENKSGDYSQDTVEASIVYLENDRFLFAPNDSKIRVYIPNDKINSVRQVNFKDVEEDDYIIIRNERDTKLIAEVADQDVLKMNAKDYRNLQNNWKNKLRLNVQKKGAKNVSDILMKKYHLETASAQSVRSWCAEDSICPTELPKLLRAFKYEEDEIKNIHSVMKEIRSAHQKAGRLISEKLMNELSDNILQELKEKGFYTFQSQEFNGASFNIERIVSIDNTAHQIAPHNLMKPFDLD